MYRFTVFFMFILTANFLQTHGQIFDDFSDGNLTTDPTWIGNIDEFIINDEKQLQLNAPAVAGQSQLAISSKIINDAEWSFHVKLTFNPSSNNFLDIYLVSDQSDLSGALNGYFVRIGNTADEISLYRQSGSKSTVQKIIDGVDDRVDQSTVAINVKVIRSATGFWELLVDEDLTQNYVSEGVANDSTFYYSNYFGILCNYTATRSDRFYLDDIDISGKAFSDNDPPQIDSLVVLSDSSLQVDFNEKMLVSSVSNAGHYVVNHGIGQPETVDLVDESTIILYFNKKFEDGLAHQISLNSVSDPFGNLLENLPLSFTYEAPYIISFGDIVITEIMADPTPEIDLPEYEYLELHNPKNENFFLEQVKLIVGQDTTYIPDLLINSKEYIILCQHAAVDQLERFGKTIKITNWPSLNNRGEQITLLNIKNEIIYSVDYNDSWYKSIDKDDGGYSIEMIDMNRPCLGEKNWIASRDPDGGTPGRENASKDEIIDVSPPVVDNVIATSNHSINVHLSESIGPQNLDIDIFSLSPEIEIENIRLLQPEFIDLKVTLNTLISPKTVYELTLTNLADCSGNIQKGNVSAFVLPEPVDTLDLIINEILFDPVPGGVDFVEIYNQSEKYIDLSSIGLGNEQSKPIITDHFIIKPKQFIAISENASLLQNQYPGLDLLNVVSITEMPAFNNDAGDVFLTNAHGQILDFFHYDADFHSRFLNDVEGVSLERISYEGPTNDANNWQSASGSVGFATPGKANSQAQHVQSEVAEIVIEPKVFVPGDMGFQSFTTIKCKFSDHGNMASIYILDPTGRKIKTILSHKSIGVQDNFKWEGLDDNGQLVRMGPYIVYIEVLNLSGSKKLFREKVVVGGKF